MDHKSKRIFRSDLSGSTYLFKLEIDERDLGCEERLRRNDQSGNTPVGKKWHFVVLYQLSEVQAG
jgi:hypothetical protein